MPLVLLGRLMNFADKGSIVPLYDFYKDKSFKRIKQDVYDRFFTAIEQRVSKKEIQELTDTFTKVLISRNLPFWHFYCKR